jgi:hypothetical protein
MLLHGAMYSLPGISPWNSGLTFGEIVDLKGPDPM